MDPQLIAQMVVAISADPAPIVVEAIEQKAVVGASRGQEVVQRHVSYSFLSSDPSNWQGTARMFVAMAPATIAVLKAALAVAE